MTVILCCPSAFAQGAPPIFFDDFSKDATGLGLAGQGGWFQDSTNTAPMILSATTALAPSVAVDGLHRTGTGAYNGTSFSEVRHVLSRPLNPNGITILSVDAYAFNAYQSHASGIELSSSNDGQDSVAFYASWYPSHSPAWTIVKDAGGGSQYQDYIYGFFDQRVRLEIVVDGGVGVYYGRLTSSGGVVESPHQAISASEIAALSQVVLFEDFRDVYLGVDLANVAVTTGGCQVNVDTLAVLASMLASFTPPNGLTVPAYASVCGFAGFDWQQTITSMPCPNKFEPYKPSALPLSDFCPGGGITAKVPFNDPVSGGWTYIPLDNFNVDPYPFYYAAKWLLNDEQSPNTVCALNPFILGPCIIPVVSSDDKTLNFYDAPADSELPDGTFMGFTTSLVGINPDGSPSPSLFHWSWTSTFNGTSGGTSATYNTFPTDPGSGTGGAQ